MTNNSNNSNNGNNGNNSTAAPKAVSDYTVITALMSQVDELTASITSRASQLLADDAEMVQAVQEMVAATQAIKKTN
ncbi:hypothetical protein GQ42DRAFT_19004 [Ramicandelaber brevisporus]|nr:hypothetical protein GQ42DRAFT_19004 [Ramicandelaber brevisporus]